MTFGGFNFVLVLSSVVSFVLFFAVGFILCLFEE